jgi:DNA-binding NtrC family response regulator
MASPAMGIAPAAVSDVRVLFVSSDPDACESLRSIFSRTNWQLRVVSGCQEGVQALANEPFPVVLCEQKLPDGSWRLLLPAIDNTQHRPKLIVCSDRVDTSLFGEVLNLGAYDLLGKPFDAGEVLQDITLAWQSWNNDRQRQSAKVRTMPLWRMASATPFRNCE